MATSRFGMIDNVVSLTVPGQTAGSPALYHRVFRTKRPLERQTFDQEYIHRLSQGEHETAKHFIGYFTKLLVVKLRSRMRSLDEAEDVAQETLYRVLQFVNRHGGIEHPERLGGFVNSVSENVVLEFYREGRRFQQVPENTPEPVEKALSAEINCITDERKQQVRSVLKTLRHGDRLVLEKVFLLEQDKDQICAELKIDRNYLRVQIHRALARFRKVLEEKGVSRAAGG